jgi:hypothetical protein
MLHMPFRRSLHAAACLLVHVVALVSVSTVGGAQPETPLPFAPGERLTYTVSTSRFGGAGKATMWIESPIEVRGVETWPLRFDFSARVGVMRARDRTASWLDARRVTSLRFLKHERHPLSRHDEEVELFPDTRRWENKDGSGGDSPTDLPLDELSFMYFLRTLAVGVEDDWRFARHYAADRNPTLVRVVQRETIETPAGTFRTVQLEMRVRDPRRYRGEGIIRISLSDDRCRIPVRIESRMPIVGAAVMVLASHNLQGCDGGADTVRTTAR